MSDVYMLTTMDNPYNPFTDYAEWDAFDQRHGYYSAALLGRVIITSHDMSDADQQHAIKLAIDEIVRENVSGMHTTIDENSVKSSIVDDPYPLTLDTLVQSN